MQRRSEEVPLLQRHSKEVPHSQLQQLLKHSLSGGACARVSNSAWGRTRKDDRIRLRGSRTIVTARRSSAAKGSGPWLTVQCGVHVPRSSPMLRLRKKGDEPAAPPAADKLAAPSVIKASPLVSRRPLASPAATRSNVVGHASRESASANELPVLGVWTQMGGIPDCGPELFAALPVLAVLPPELFAALPVLAVLPILLCSRAPSLWPNVDSLPTPDPRLKTCNDLRQHSPCLLLDATRCWLLLP